MKIKFLGASGTVTGSSYLLTSDLKQSILIDLGMFQGPPEIEKLNSEKVDCDFSKLSGVILTHAHLDHCGRLPLLIKGGFKGNIYMTAPTSDLTKITLLDSAKIAKEDRNNILYNQRDVLKTIKNFVIIDYHKEIYLGDFIFKMYDAGHILGSAFVEIKNKKNGKKVIFSADLGNFPAQLEEKTEFVDFADFVIMESTYGDRLHSKENPSEILQKEINIIEKTNGTLLIPSFSLDRAQELLHMIMHLKKDDKILSNTPIILDSPMAEKATVVYTKYPTLFNDHVENEAKTGSIFDFPGLKITQNWKESRGIHETKGAKVIIAGSGMMTGGRIVTHAKYCLGVSNTRVLIVGYQADGTLGRELLNGKKEIKIDNQKIQVKASISETQAMSAHADYNQLMEWLKNISGIKKLFLIHGEDAARAALKDKVSENLGIPEIFLPKLNEEFLLE